MIVRSQFLLRAQSVDAEHDAFMRKATFLLLLKASNKKVVLIYCKTLNGEFNNLPFVFGGLAFAR